MNPSGLLVFGLLVPIALASDGTCDTSSLLQKGQGAASELSFSQTMTFSSPEFQKLLPEIDDKMVPIKKAKIPGDECLRRPWFPS
eukprot:Skav211999  [mRNA]  locus=scaffold304:94546:94956:+ [translate_table: standard]